MTEQKILLAKHAGFCMGVKSAVDKALELKGKCQVLGDIIHNETVIADLKSKGVNNPDILACLLRRSIVYLKLSYESASFADLPAVFRLTQSWCDAAQISTASKSVFFKNTFRLFAAKRFPPALYVYFKIKLFIKKISKRLGLG